MEKIDTACHLQCYSSCPVEVQYSQSWIITRITSV